MLMFHKFDAVLAKALSSEKTLYGIRDRELLIATARRAAVDNRVKALNEVSLGAFHFAKIHEIASIHYDEDAEALAKNQKPPHLSIVHYFAIADGYRNKDQGRPRSTSPHLKIVA